MSSNCPRCGRRTRAGAQFCGFCGAPLAATAPGRLASGHVLKGRYKVVRPLSKGGMGAIYLVEDNSVFGKQRVVKEMLDYVDPADYPDAAAYQQAVQHAHRRFEEEARTLASLRHHGIPDIMDYFSEAGHNYIVMEYIEGTNLEQRLTHDDAQGRKIAGRPYPADEVIRYGIQVCKVLEYLAGLAQPVVHQDIKPANLIVDPTGGVWLVDFGTAKARLAVQPGGKVGLQKSSVYGTVGYAPPEQYKGQSEPRSDVYALGATLYHLATDDDPRGHPFRFPRLAALPPGLGAALGAALEQDVTRRPTAAQFRSQLEALQQQPVVPCYLRGGAAARNVAELVQACDGAWEDGKFHLYRGDFEQCLRKWGRADLEAKAAEIRQRVADQDVGLDEFLRELDPNYPPPQIQVTSPVQDVGRVPWGEQRTVQLEVRNAGKGCLQGKIMPQAAWLAVGQAEFVARDRQVLAVTVDTGRIMPKDGQVQKGSILLDAGRGGQATVEIRVTVPEPKVVVSPAALDLGKAREGEKRSGKITVSNQGDSPCEVAIVASAGWVKAMPDRFRCEPGRNVALTVEASTGRLKWGVHKATLSLQSTAGSWQVQTKTDVTVEVLDPEYEEKQALARLEKASQTDDDEQIVAAWVPILENYGPAQRHRPRKALAEKRLAALRQFEEAVATDDDEQIIRGYNGSLLDGYPKVKEAHRQRLKLARDRVEALKRVRDALRTGDERRIAAAYDKILDNYPKLSQDERQQIERALRCVAMPDLVRQAIQANDDEGIDKAYDLALDRHWMGFTSQERQRIQLAQQRQAALRIFRQALAANDDDLIVAVYQPDLLDGYPLVTDEERRRLAEARRRVASSQRSI